MFSEFVASNINQLAVDSETTGLDIYSNRFKMQAGAVRARHRSMGGAGAARRCKFEDIVMWALLTVK